MNPPRKRKITELKYEEAISSPPNTPSSGNKTKGIKEVAARGIASVIHHRAIRDAIAAVYVILGLSGSRSVKRIKYMKIKIPDMNPIFEEIVTVKG